MGKTHVIDFQDAEEKITHGGNAIFRVLVDDERCGARHFSLLVNTMKAGLNCNLDGAGHSHAVEHAIYGLSGSGGISIDGQRFALVPGKAAFIPEGTMHFVWADPGEDFTYLVVYAPPGPEKAL